MKKKKIIAFGEMFLLVSMSFAIAFIWGEGMMVEASDIGPQTTTGMRLGSNAGTPAQTGGVTGFVGPPSSAASGLGATTTNAISEFAADGTQIIQGGTSYLVKDGGLYVLRGPGYMLAEPGTVIQAGGQTITVGSEAGKIVSGNIVKAPSTATGLKGIFSGSAFGTGSTAGIMSSLLSGAIWGAIVGGAAYLLAGMFGLNDNQAASIGMTAGFGTFAGTTSYFLASNGILGTTLKGVSGLFGLGVGLGVGVAVLLATYKTEKKELVKFECLPWEAPTGGSHCDECNNDPLMPCSEYRCKSLGQACGIVNPGTTDEMCVWISKGDTAAPHIEPWDEALSPDGLGYNPDTAISPPNRGFKIQSGKGDGCLPAFTKLEFGITTDEPAQCRIDYYAVGNYSSMQFLFGESNLFLTEHTQKLRLPNSQEGEGSIPAIGVGGTFILWVRCIDANGNGEDGAAVAFSFCVDQGPDTTQPTIEGTSIETGNPVQYNVDTAPIEVYVNEPANCKWSRQDKAYDAMENEMSCSTETYQINADLNYVCSADLTGIKDKEENWFYFRCEDKNQNVMTTSYPLLLQGTQELTISSVGPDGEFSGGTAVIPVTLTVETVHGANDGEAVCAFSTVKDDSSSFVSMDNTKSYLHNQTLDLTAESYTYYFRCVDAGGNLATANTTFSVVTDTSYPRITRVFRDGNVFKVITDEDAKCYYSTSNCDYELADGLPMIYEDPTKKNMHTVDWKESVTYYVRCEDMNGNEPSMNSCQIIVRAGDL
jgi:hypothetical protein